MKQTKFLAILSLLCCHLLGVAQTDITKPDLSTPSLIAPDYFGPNAFPIPDMLDGTLVSQPQITLAGEYYAGYRGDHTYNAFLKATFPLFSDRVNLSLWMPVIEYYQRSDESREANRLPEDIAMSGHEVGDAYVSTDIQLLREQGYRPDLILRSCLKTASSNCYYTARYYDAPGYFFDLTAAKSISFKHNTFKELRVVLTTGFLCWQTDNGRQNDATMYGVQLKLRTNHLSISQTFGGYAGWERDGDHPMSLKTALSLHLKGAFEPIAAYEYGLQDYPYHHFRVGVTYNFGKK